MYDKHCTILFLHNGHFTFLFLPSNVLLICSCWRIDMLAMGPSSQKHTGTKGTTTTNIVWISTGGEGQKSPSATLFHSSRLCMSTSGATWLETPQPTESYCICCQKLRNGKKHLRALGTISPYAHQPHLKSSNGCGSRCAHRLITHHIVKQYSRALSPNLIKTIPRSIHQRKVVLKKEGCPVVSG